MANSSNPPTPPTPALRTRPPAVEVDAKRPAAIVEPKVNLGSRAASNGKPAVPTRAAPAPPTPAVSVVLPVYNESGLIAKTFAAVASFARTHPEYEFIFVDDGSSDGTALLLRDMIAGGRDRAKKGEGTVELLACRPNAGKGRAVKVGVEHSRGGLVLFTDGDLAYSLDHLPILAEALATHDVVIGSRALVHRSERNTTVLRRITGWTFNKFARLILGLPYRDTQAGLKGFRAEAARQIFALEHLGGFAFDVELVYIARRLKMRIGEIPALVAEAHSYKVSKVRLVRDSARMFWALIDVRLCALRGRYKQSMPSHAKSQR